MKEHGLGQDHDMAEGSRQNGEGERKTRLSCLVSSTLTDKPAIMAITMIEEVRIRYAVHAFLLVLSMLTALCTLWFPWYVFVLFLANHPPLRSLSVRFLTLIVSAGTTW